MCVLLLLRSSLSGRVATVFTRRRGIGGAAVHATGAMRRSPRPSDQVTASTRGEPSPAGSGPVAGRGAPRETEPAPAGDAAGDEESEPRTNLRWVRREPPHHKASGRSRNGPLRFVVLPGERRDDGVHRRPPPHAEILDRRRVIRRCRSGEKQRRLIGQAVAQVHDGRQRLARPTDTAKQALAQRDPPEAAVRTRSRAVIMSSNATRMPPQT